MTQDSIFETIGYETRLWIRRRGEYPAQTIGDWEVATRAPVDEVDGGWRMIAGPARTEAEVAALAGLPTLRPIGDDEVFDAMWVADRLCLAGAIGHTLGVGITDSAIAWAERPTIGFDGFADLRFAYHTLLTTTEAVVGDRQPLGRRLLHLDTIGGEAVDVLATAVVARVVDEALEDAPEGLDLDDVNARLDPWHLEIVDDWVGEPVPEDVGLVILDRISGHDIPLGWALSGVLADAQRATAG